MALFTMTVEDICKSFVAMNYPDSKIEEMSVDEIIVKAQPFIFNFDYPTYTPEQKNNFEQLFLNTYYVQEICAETEALWQQLLKTRLRLIMPYYIQLYKSEEVTIDPLAGDKITDTSNDVTQGENSDEYTTNSKTDTTTTNSGKNRSVRSDLPNQPMTLTDLEGEFYANQANLTQDEQNNQGTSETNNSGNSSGNNRTEKNTTYSREIITGNQPEAIMKFRESFININKMIIDELGDLFMSLWYTYYWRG